MDISQWMPGGQVLLSWFVLLYHFSVLNKSSDMPRMQLLCLLWQKKVVKNCVHFQCWNVCARECVCECLFVCLLVVTTTTLPLYEPWKRILQLQQCHYNTCVTTTHTHTHKYEYKIWNKTTNAGISKPQRHPSNMTLPATNAQHHYHHRASAKQQHKCVWHECVRSSA